MVTGWVPSVNYHLYGYDLDTNYMETVNGFTSDYFKQLAAKILADGNVIEILMTPETAAEVNPVVPKR